MARREIHVLLVEDYEDTAVLTREFLGVQGDYTVQWSPTLEAACVALQARKFDVILLDYNLSDANGLQSLEMINSLNVNTPVVMVTARGDERVAVKSVKAGAADYIVKTSSYLETLPDVMNRVIQQYELRRAVAEAEERYRYLFEQANDAIFICDEYGIIMESNHTASEWLGIAADDLIGRSLAEFEHTDGAASSDQLREALLREGEMVYELNFRRLDGRIFTSEVSARLVRQGDHVLCQYIVRDITHRKTMEAELLRRSRELAAMSEVTAAINRSLELNEVLTAALDGVMGALQIRCGAIYLEGGLDELLLAASRGFSEEFQARCRMLTLSQLSAHDMPPRLGDLPGWLAEEPVSTFMAVALNSRDNRLGYLVLADQRRTPFSGDEYNFTRVNCDRIAVALENARLLSELQTSIEATRMAQAQLVRAARLSAVGELAAGVAHQINNPLTTVIADAQLLMKTLDGEHPGRVSAEAIFQAGWRAQRVVQRLLNFARPQEEKFEPTQVNDTIQSALDLLVAYLQRSGVKLVVDLDQTLPKIMASGHQLEEMWINLLLNAREALLERPEAHITIETRLLDEADAIRVEIADNGVGIDPESLQNIFEPFFTTRRGEGGTGLGLSVCQTIVQHHSGIMRAYSALGEGTKFTVHLPLTQETARRQRSRTKLMEDVLNSKLTFSSERAGIERHEHQ